MSDDRTGPLVRRAQDGDSSAVEKLFARYLPRVRQIVALRLRYRSSDFSTIEDHVQDALLRVFENLDHYEESSEGRFRNWIATCVANSVRNDLRDARAAKRGGGRVLTFAEAGFADLPSAIFSDGGPTASAILQGKESLEHVESTLLELGERDRELIILRRLCEMSYAEIAEVLDSSETAIRQAFYRAMQRLQKASGFGEIAPTPT